MLTQPHPLAGRKSLKVAERLLEQIGRGELLEGRKFPPERELVEKFKVSRGVIREAFNSLQMAGIVERHVGDGTYLAEGVEARQLKALSLRKGLDASTDVLEAIEAREALDLVVIGLAIENARQDDLDSIDEILKEMRRSIEAGDIRRYLPLTLDLHLAIAQAGGNGVLVKVIGYLIDIIRPSLWIIEQNYTSAIAEHSFQVHKDMADAVRDRDLAKAQTAVHEHYHEYPSLKC